MTYCNNPERIIPRRHFKSMLLIDVTGKEKIVEVNPPAPKPKNCKN